MREPASNNSIFCGMSHPKLMCKSQTNLAFTRFVTGLTTLASEREQKAGQNLCNLKMAE